jgi:hypothetical protein
MKELNLIMDQQAMINIFLTHKHYKELIKLII